MPEAAHIISELDSYTEASPSGTGIRILLLGKLPGIYRRRGTIELYEDRRFLTLTGHTFPEAPEDIEPRQAELSGLYQRIFANENPNLRKENAVGGVGNASKLPCLTRQCSIKPWLPKTAPPSAATTQAIRRCGKAQAQSTAASLRLILPSSCCCCTGPTMIAWQLTGCFAAPG
jgi:hypothetical protein